MVALNRNEELRLHLLASANNGVTREEIKEVLLQRTIYCGVPAAHSPGLPRPRVQDGNAI
jgi:alkylhydroperoxidase/carboxymuconolactone decarboxylase family protein YurZ